VFCVWSDYDFNQPMTFVVSTRSGLPLSIREVDRSCRLDESPLDWVCIT
jgi:hypothetical protein